jgi:hypothetical protein
MSDLYDFIWPTVSVLVYVRSRAHKLKTLSPSQQNEALKKWLQSPRNLRAEYRTISGLKRASLAKTLIQDSWRDQEQIIASLVLINIFAIYEGWLDDLWVELDPGQQLGGRKKFIDAVQFPYRTRKHEDWTWAASQLSSARSSDLEACFGARLRSKRLYSAADILSLLKCYRIFKEIRNVLIHRNGKVGQYLIAAQTDFSSVSTIGNRSIPLATASPVVLGGDIFLSLYGIVGFNDVVLRIMATLDAEAGVTIFGENALEHFYASAVVTKSISGNRDSTLRKMIHEYGLWAPTNVRPFEAFLNRRAISIP